MIANVIRNIFAFALGFAMSSFAIYLLRLDD